jgi:hypothetical protein
MSLGNRDIPNSNLIALLAMLNLLQNLKSYYSFTFYISEVNLILASEFYNK